MVFRNSSIFYLFINDSQVEWDRVLHSPHDLLLSRDISVGMSFWLKFMPVIFIFLVGCRQNANDKSGDNINERILRARKCVADDRSKEAIKILEEGVHIHGDVPEISELLANTHLSIGDDELAAFYFEQAAGLSDLHYHCYLKAAEIYEKMKDYGQALLCYRLYLDILPEDNEVQIKYADVFLCDGQKKNALEILVRYVEESVEIRNRVAALFFDFGNYIQARNWYLSALAGDKNNLSALGGLWKISLLFGNWNALLEVGTKLLALGEKFLGNIPIQSVVDAIKGLQKASNELKKVDLNCEKIALPVFMTDAIDSSVSVIGDAMSREATMEADVTKQEKITALKGLLEKARSRGDYEEAILVLWKILGVDGKNVEAWTELTECLQKTNKYAVAEMAIQEAIKFEPECVDFYVTYLDIVLCTHSSADYVRLLKDVKHRFPTDPEIRLRWANAQEIYMDDAMGAKRSYEKFLELAPSNHPEILRVKRLLQAYGKGEDNEKKRRTASAP
jgi:tetratricopeptide (TPR) repeat protein